MIKEKQQRTECGFSKLARTVLQIIDPIKLTEEEKVHFETTYHALRMGLCPSMYAPSIMILNNHLNKNGVYARK